MDLKFDYVMENDESACNNIDGSEAVDDEYIYVLLITMWMMM